MQIVMGGDFNCALAPLDKTGTGTSTERRKIVTNKIVNYDLQGVCGDYNIPASYPGATGF